MILLLDNDHTLTKVYILFKDSKTLAIISTKIKKKPAKIRSM